MDNEFTRAQPVQDFPLWEKASARRVPISFDLELTARCNNDCRHCYINLAAGDVQARSRELTVAEINDLAEQAVELGSLWCLITGGEPLLRNDFADIYTLLKRKGLLLSVFTNACLITEEHVSLFQRYPPRDIEISVYGVTQVTYEKVTRKPGSYAAFRRGLDLLLNAGIPVRLKAMALRSNVEELPEIARFCRKHTKDYFRFDPLLHLRYDRDPARNAEIREERLSSEEIAAVEQADTERSEMLAKHCDEMILADVPPGSDQIFACGAGLTSFSITYDGFFKLCSSLMNANSLFDLRQGSLRQAWYEFVPQMRGLRSTSPEFLTGCRACALINLCLWCPANADLEFGEMDAKGEYFCQVAHARAEKIQPRDGS